MLAVIVDASTFRIIRGENPQLYGRIFFDLGQDQYFPRHKWADFPLVMLNIWIRNIIHSLHGHTAECLFIEGPYYFTLTGNHNNFEIFFIEHREHKKNILYTVSIDKKDFVEQILDVTETILHFIHTQKVTFAETEELEKWYEALQAVSDMGFDGAK